MDDTISAGIPNSLIRRLISIIFRLLFLSSYLFILSITSSDTNIPYSF